MADLETIIDLPLVERSAPLLGRDCAFPAEHLSLKRSAVIEGENVKGLVKADTGHEVSL
jgi:hypothetical protein